MGPVPAFPLPPNPQNSPPKIRSLPNLDTSIKKANSPLSPEQQPPLSPRVIRNISQDIYQRQIQQQQQLPQHKQHQLVPSNQITRRQSEETTRSKESTTTKQQPSRLNSGSQTLFSKTNMPSIGIKQKTASALTSLISGSVSSDNPFAKEFAFFSGKGVLDAIRLKIYLPFSDSPDNPLLIVIRSDATIDDVIGYTLFEYLNEKRLPKVPSNLSDISLWTMRIVEDDGSIDQDFPGCLIQQLWRELVNIPGQVKMYIRAAKSNVSQPKGSPGAQKLSTVPVSPLVAVRSVNGPSGSNTVFFLKIHLYSTIEVKQTTTVQMPGSTLLSEVFEQVCKKRKYDPSVYVLKMPDTKTDVPLGKTLDQLKVTEFCVLKKDSGEFDCFLV
ncbi:hypothetical protein HK096_009775 [Nowakowskiella sp. JEL0078]|nr:hypothetical protein HK096_009775 [Nowakowskiella sp. JEL0078]